MKSTRSATPPDAHGPLTVRVLTNLTERQQFDALLEAEHFLAQVQRAGRSQPGIPNLPRRFDQLGKG
jgi:hypothetical protein